jgi:hypothetical protein
MDSNYTPPVAANPPLCEIPVIRYTATERIPHLSAEAVVGFSLTVSVFPGAVACAVLFGPTPAFVVLCVGSCIGLAMGLAARKEIDESNGLIRGRGFAVAAILLALVTPLILFLIVTAFIFD